MSTIKEMTNEEIVVSLQTQFDDRLFAELYHRFRPLVYSGIQLYKIPLFTIEDYCQEGRIALFHAVQRFDKKRNVHFARFIQLIYKNHLCNILRHEQALKRGGKGNKCTTDIRLCEQCVITNVDLLDLAEQTLFALPEDRAIVHDQAGTYFTCLSDLERKVLAYFLQGMDAEAIAHHMEISQEKAGAAYDRCRQKFRKMLRGKSECLEFGYNF